MSADSLAIFLGFHSTEHMVLQKDLLDFRRTIGKERCEFWAMNKSPRKQEIEDNPASKSAKMFSVRVSESIRPKKKVINRQQELQKINNFVF